MKTARLIFLLSAAFIAGMPGFSWALSTVAFDEVKTAMDGGATLIDVRSESQYKGGHLPGALNVSFFEMMDDTQHLVPPEDMAAIMADFGVGRSGTKVVYGMRGLASMQASYMGWVLAYLGAEDVKVYVGGIDDWKERGGSLSREIASPKSAEFEAQLRSDLRVDAEYIAKHLDSGDITLVDTRMPGEFFGQDIRAVRGGHIPGAVNLIFPVFYFDAKTQYLASSKELAANFAMIPKDKPVIVYCQTGARASMALAAFLKAGYQDVRLYPESWKDWGSNLRLPVEDETYFDWHSVNAEISSLQSKNSELTSELQKTSASSLSNLILLIGACVVAYAGLISYMAMNRNKVVTAGIWVMVVLASGFMGLLAGYGISSYTGFEEAGSAHVEEAGGYK
ncbi:MAG: hypothetical protein IEMM0002_0534 [bacterium]|nr:MAG: hypothetical protein IEMM0002_0534 [bacterium]